jgi:hypothetical protein
MTLEPQGPVGHAWRGRGIRSRHPLPCHTTHAHSALLALQLWSKFSRSCILIKAYVEKIPGPFQFAKVTESEKYKKHDFLPAEL